MTAATASEGGTIQGVIQARQLAEGVLFEPAMKGLPPGLHGFHLHENANCDPSREQTRDTANPSVQPAGEAGDHWDPGEDGNHEGPWGHGHLGDLPNLYVDDDGLATLPVYAPRLTLRDLEQRALMVHENRDNYTDEPDGKGGSGNAIACGVFVP
ncbi:MAG: superoxide dismutase family protein [Marinobacter sp.]